MKDIYHLVQKQLWEECKTQEKAYKPPTYEQDGFIHATEEAHMLLGVANHFYKSDPSEYLLLRIDPGEKIFF